jgi:putative phosphoribosyl transferase
VLFADRTDAAEKLAAALVQYEGDNPLVLGIPRGGVPMACIISERLHGQTDVVLVRKLRAPGKPEFAIGSVDESGWVYLAAGATMDGVDDAYIASENALQLQTIRARRAAYTSDRGSIDARGRVAIVVDDGLATGSTMVAALHAVRAMQPSQLVCAVPLAPVDTIDCVDACCDEIVCLATPEQFYAVGQFYRDFSQITDQEVMRLLRPRGGC